jgi:hypothetical protein
MDDYMFRSHVQNCKYVPETTSYIEILNYSVRFPFGLGEVLSASHQQECDSVM